MSVLKLKHVNLWREFSFKTKWISEKIIFTLELCNNCVCRDMRFRWFNARWDLFFPCHVLVSSIKMKWWGGITERNYPDLDPANKWVSQIELLNTGVYLGNLVYSCSQWWPGCPEIAQTKFWSYSFKLLKLESDPKLVAERKCIKPSKKWCCIVLSKEVSVVKTQNLYCHWNTI